MTLCYYLVDMPRLSSSISELKNYYPVLVIGSGYGGAIAASRLARAGQQVCVLERGREFQSGEYPDTEAEALAEMQAELPSGHTGSRTGLYDFYVNPDVNVFVGCGLGGTSLINGNVAVRPEARVFEDARWPAALRNDADGLAAGFARAAEMLRPVPYPARYPALPKLLALEQSAAHLGQTCSRAPITVNFEEGMNPAGVMQHSCMLCGDCVTGCNYGAKNTVAFNYLPDARNFGAEIYTQAAVRRIERRDGRWVAYYQVLETGREEFDAPERSVAADIVVVAAGTLGSTEILLRSKAAGLALSDQVGRRFSGNGDVLGYSFGCTEEIRGVGYGHRDARDMEAVGPCVTGLIDMRGQANLDDGIAIQEFVTPGALANLLPQALAAAGAALGTAAGEGLDEAVAMEGEIESLFTGPYETQADHTQAYLVTTHEGGTGQMRLEADRLHVEWPKVGDQPIFEKVNATLAEATRALGGQYLINPVWSAVFHKDLVTVHPLGGCAMAEDGAGGAVNHKGQAFSGDGTEVHDGLYVLDGSTIPRSLGAGPLLTISALSERACALMAQDRGWAVDYSLPSRPASGRAAGPMGVRFEEVARDAEMEVDLTAVCEDAEQAMRVGGRVRVRAIGEQMLKVADGWFDLGSLTYRLKLAGADGRSFNLEALRAPVSLRIKVYEGGAVLAEHTLFLAPRDLQRQLSTLRVSNAGTAKQRFETTARMGRALAGEFYDIYGNTTAERKKRPLRVNAPTVHPFVAGETKGRLIRYEGGSHGPVLVAGEAALRDTIDTNLVEFLFAHSYDVWVMEGEGGDQGAAVAAVKAISRAQSVLTPAAEFDAAAIGGKHAARDVYPRMLATLVKAG